MDKKISELNSMTEIKDDDLFVVVDSSEPLETKKIVGDAFKDYLGVGYIQGSFYNDSAAVFANGSPGVEDPSSTTRDGWYYQNTVVGQKINWYFFDSTNAMGSTISLGNFGAYAVVSFDSLDSGPIMSVYTLPTGSGDVIPGFAHSAVAYSAGLSGKVLGKKYLVYFGSNPTIHPELDRIQLSKSGSGGGDQDPSEVVFTVSYGSNSGAELNSVKMMVESLGVNSTGYKTKIGLKIRSATKGSFDSLEDRVEVVEGKSVESYDELADFPSEGVDSKLYLAKNINRLYRWDGDEYVEIAVLDVSEVPPPTGVSVNSETGFSLVGGAQYPFGQKGVIGLEGNSSWNFTTAPASADHLVNYLQHGITWDESGSLSSVSHYSVDYSPDSGFTWFNLADGIQNSQLPRVNGRVGIFPAYGQICITGSNESCTAIIPLNINSFPCCPNSECSGTAECSYFNSEALLQLAEYRFLLGYARPETFPSRKLIFRVKAHNEFGMSSEYSYTSEPPADYSSLQPPTGINVFLGDGSYNVGFEPPLDKISIKYEVQIKSRHPLISDIWPTSWTPISQWPSGGSPLRSVEIINGQLGTPWFSSPSLLDVNIWNIRIRAVDQAKNLLSEWAYRYEEVLHYENLAAFPENGDAQVVYVADDTDKSYRWQGSAYQEVTSLTPPLEISDIDNLQEELDNKLSVDSVIDGGGY